MLRYFKDDKGRSWRVWDVTPTRQSSAALRRNAPTASEGWLCFETDDERRRLSPVPGEWSRRDDAGLNELLQTAELVRPILNK
jgi:hypothetical protein